MISNFRSEKCLGGKFLTGWKCSPISLENVGNGEGKKNKDFNPAIEKTLGMLINQSSSSPTPWGLHGRLENLQSGRLHVGRSVWGEKDKCGDGCIMLLVHLLAEQLCMFFAVPFKGKFRPE